MRESQSSQRTPPHAPLAAWYRGLLWVLFFGMVGLAVELLLIKHTDGGWQLFPLVLLGTGPVMIAWYLRSQTVSARRALVGSMWLYVFSGLVGTLLHFKGNVAYEQESNPGLTGRALYLGAVQGSTPTLAPGAMIQLGVLGLIVVLAGKSFRGADAADERS